MIQMVAVIYVSVFTCSVTMKTKLKGALC